MYSLNRCCCIFLFITILTTINICTIAKRAVWLIFIFLDFLSRFFFIFQFVICLIAIFVFFMISWKYHSAFDERFDCKFRIFSCFFCQSLFWYLFESNSFWFWHESKKHRKNVISNFVFSHLLFMSKLTNDKMLFLNSRIIALTYIWNKTNIWICFTTYQLIFSRTMCQWLRFVYLIFFSNRSFEFFDQLLIIRFRESRHAFFRTQIDFLSTRQRLFYKFNDQSRWHNMIIWMYHLFLHDSFTVFCYNSTFLLRQKFILII